MALAVAVLPGVPGQVAAQLPEEGVHQALLPALAVVALVVPDAVAEASLAGIVWNKENTKYLDFLDWHSIDNLNIWIQIWKNVDWFTIH